MTVTWNKGKTLGQIAYEAMLPLSRKHLDKMFPKTAGPPFFDDAWEAQSQQLRDDWEAVARAVRTADMDLETVPPVTVSRESLHKHFCRCPECDPTGMP